MTFAKYVRIPLAFSFALLPYALHAADQVEPIFEIVSLEGTVDGQGFAGMPGNDELWTTSADATNFDEFPINLEGWAFGPLGGVSFGEATLDGVLVPTGMHLHGHAISSSDGGENNEYAMTWAQVHGDIVFDVQEEALLQYAFVTSTLDMQSIAFLWLQKADGTEWNPVYELTSESEGAQETLTGETTIEAGTYRLIFYAVADTQNIDMDWPETEAQFAATLRITPADEQQYDADINGDGKVDGIDMGRLLGAWGTSASGGDLNGDGVVDGQDLAILLAAWTG